MNVYDFDKTIYAGDSTVDFYFYCLRHRPLVLLSAPYQAYGIFLHAIHRIDTTAMKEYFFSFLSRIENAEKLVCSFWKQYHVKIKPWYLQVLRSTDVVISASPAFLLSPICSQLGIEAPVATDVSLHDGTIQGMNCKGPEKVRRFLERYPGSTIDRFYSDSLSDTPLADLAREAFQVNGDHLSPWPSRKTT